MTNWLVTGGAGYIGSHVARELRARGYGVVVLDDLSTGAAARVGAFSVVFGDVADVDLVRATIRDFSIEGVIHLAAVKQVEDSVRRPTYYYRRNLCALTNLLDAMGMEGVEKIVFSSSAAVYGAPPTSTVSEDEVKKPTNPYGETKLAGEWLIQAEARARGLRFALLRYFNVAGAGAPDIGDVSGTSLIPSVLSTLQRGDAPRIFGDDYSTTDGTCVRDYVHVVDIASAHVAAAQLLLSERAAYTLNVGRGHGYSVREVIEYAMQISGVDRSPLVVERRRGDAPSVVAATNRITELTNWRPQFDLHDMVSSAWQSQEYQRSLGEFER